MWELRACGGIEISHPDKEWGFLLGLSARCVTVAKALTFSEPWLSNLSGRDRSLLGECVWFTCC